MKRSLILLLLSSLSTACHAPDGSDRLANVSLFELLGDIGDTYVFAKSVEDFITDDEDSSSDDIEFITPAHPTD